MKEKLILIGISTITALFTSYLFIKLLISGNIPEPRVDPYARFRTQKHVAAFLKKCEQNTSGPNRCSQEESQKYTRKAKKLFNFQGIMSQSDGHLQQNACVAWHNIITIVSNPIYKSVFDEALAYERSIVNNRAVFYHAQQNIYYWLELLYTKLWERKYNRPLNNYIFLRFPNEQSPEIIAVEQQNGTITRKQWLMHGRKKKHTPQEITSAVLGTNYALFANAKNHLCSTVQYFVHGFNDFDPKITTRDIVAKFSSKDIYQTHKPLFDEIEQEFKVIVPSSVLLQIMLPFHALKDHVYLSTQGSWKTSIYIHDTITDDIHTILHTLKTNPAAFPESDIPVFRIIVTPDSIHTLREQEAEIRVYGCFDKEKLHALTLKLESFINRMAKENPEVFSGNLQNYA